MSSARPRPRWLFLVSPRWLAWHGFAVLAAWGMLWLGDWQFHRAENGNPLSWAYTFEWPIFTIFGVIFWAKTIADEWRQPGGAANHAAALRAAGLAPADELALPGAAHTPALTDDEADADPELAAYNAYLSRLNRQATPTRQTTRKGAGSAP
jgi:hypothetical protein